MTRLLVGTIALGFVVAWPEREAFAQATPAEETAAEETTAPDSPQPSPPATPAEPTPATPVAPVLGTPAPAAEPAVPSASATPSANMTATGYDKLDLFDLLSFKVPTVTSSSKHEESASEAPATVIVITHEDIWARGYVNLKDVLRDLPGMETIENYFSEQGTLVPVRGVSGNNKIVVLVNGMRVNPPGGEAMMFNSDFSVRDAEQIEINYGPGSTLYGQDAISAVIDVRTKKPTSDSWFNVGMQGGYPTRYDTWANLNRKIGDGAVTGYIQYFNAQLTDLSKSWADEWNQNYLPAAAAKGGVGAAPSRWDRGLNAFMRFELGSSSVQAWHRQNSRSSSETLPGNFARIPSAKWDDMSTVVEGRNKLKLSDSVAIESSLSFNRYEIRPQTRYVWEDTPSTWNMDDYKYGLGTSASLEEKVSAQVTKSISLLGGIVLSHYDILPKATIPGGAQLSQDVPSQGGYFTYYTAQGDPTSAVTVARASNIVYQNIGAYLEGAWWIADPLKLIVGFRADRDTRYSTTPVSPRGALIYRPTKEIAVKGIFTMAYVAPPPYFSYSVFLSPTEMNIGNPSLEPERAMSGELNVTYTKVNLLAGFSAYYNRQSNLLLQGDSGQPANVIGQVYPDANPNTPAILLTHSANGGDSRAIGVDIYARARILKYLSAWGSASYVDYKATIGGKETGLPGISALNLRLGGTVTLLHDKVVATLALRVRSTPKNLPPATTSTQAMTDAAAWPYDASLFVIYKATSMIDIFADLQNLTNHHYAQVGIFGTPVPKETFSAISGLRIAY